MKTASVVTLRSEPPAPAVPSALLVPLARARGRLDLGFKRRGAETVLDTLFQEGCAKARFPRREAGAFTGAVLLNTAGGATWVSIHHGGGVGIGRSIHAGQVSLADGTELAAQKLARVLSNDPGMGVIRHVDAGYERADEIAADRAVRIPMKEGI